MTQDAQIITAKVGDIVEIPLEAMLSAGFQWEIFLPEEATAFKVLEVKWEKTPELPRAPGTPTIQKFRLQILSRGATKIVFHYKRPWENKIRKEKMILLKVR